jgi:hypothetical protein
MTSSSPAREVEAVETTRPRRAQNNEPTGRILYLWVATRAGLVIVPLPANANHPRALQHGASLNKSGRAAE